MDHYPLALQLLMNTDGTVTDLIQLLSGEKIQVVKVSENINKSLNILNRHIFLKGEQTQTNWLYAESQIYFDNLPKGFVQDLLEKTIPIGALWVNYRMETFKQLIGQNEEVSTCSNGLGFKFGTELLSRTYQVFSQKSIIMEITEKFPIHRYLNIVK